MRTEVDAPAEAPSRRTTLASGTGREGDLVLAGAVLVLLVAYVPGLDQGATTVRLLVALPVGAVGLVLAVRAATQRDRAAWWGLGYLAWAGVAALASTDVRRSVLPAFGTDRGWVVLAAFVGWFFVGRSRGPDGRRLVARALVAGLVANAIVAVGQVVVDGDGVLALSDGRALGLLPSPVYLGTVLAGALGLAAWRAARAPAGSWTWLVLLVLFAMATEASGSRSTLLAGPVVAVLVSWRAGWRRLALVVAAIVVGAAAMVPFGTSSSSTDRLAAEPAGGVTPRLIMWDLAVESAAERPILGWGPDQFLAVTGPRITAEFARAEGPERRFFDAHNLPLEQVVSTGLVGAALLAGFGWSIGRRAAGAPAAFAAGAALTWLVEPVSVATAPLVLVALGVAAAVDDAGGGPPNRDRAGLGVGWRLAATAAALVALVGGARLLWADVLVARAIDTADVTTIERAGTVLPGDPVIADLETQARLSRAEAAPDPDPRPVVAAARRTIALEPDDATWWYRLAEAEALALSSPIDPEADAAALERVRVALARSQELNPWSARALRGLAIVAELTGDEEAAARWTERRCQVVDCG